MLGLAMAACAKSTVPPIPSSVAAPELYAPTVESEYLIQPGDVLAVRSYYDPQVNQEVQVRPDGRISLLFMGDVEVAGKTIMELDRIIDHAYSREIPSVDTTVFLLDSAGLGVYLAGEVRNPSMQPLRGSLTALQTIAMAGGFLDTAYKRQVLLMRKTQEGRFQLYEVDMERVLANEAPDIYVRRYDILYVPKSPIAEVNQFVEQYVNNVIPQAILLNFGWVRQSGSLKLE
jgi:protein involved in polysaccharide export with SLBB domain